jgi:protein SCO1
MRAPVRNSLILLALLSTRAGVWAEDPLPRELEGVGVDEKIGQPVDLSLTFTADNGYPVELGSFFHKGKPVLLNLVYYSCPMLCNMVLNAQTAALRELKWTPGDEFEIVTISIDPNETFNLAQKKRECYLESYGRPAKGWHFMADHQGHAKQLAESVGFHYRYVEAQQQFAHAAAIMILTPDGRVSRYLYGVKFNPRDLRLALMEASEGKSAWSLEKLLLFCFHYDPKANSYVLFATNFMRAGGVAIVLVLTVVLLRLWRKERYAI